MKEDQKVDVYLVCNAKYHDTNFARLELLKLLGENQDIHTRVAENFYFRQAENLSFTSRRRQTLVFVFRPQLPMPCSQTSQVKIFTTTCQ